MFDTLNVIRDGDVLIANIAAPPMNLLGPKLIGDLVGFAQCVDASTPRRSAVVTRSGNERAFILRITWPRCAFTVISLMPSSAATCLLRRPETTSAMT